MAKRSDFAQKLLDDLRKRKERMSMSQKSNHSSQISAADKYRNFKRPSQGSVEITPSETFLQIGSKTWDKHRRLGSRDMSLALQESSKELVPRGRAQSSDNIADLSMALAFALKNGENLRQMESSNKHAMDFLHHSWGRSMDISEINRRQGFDRSQASGRIPTISQLHIKEISRGAQKLNQILKACCDGLNFDKYSIDVGKELLKGAIDLEESLRMLVNLQEASDNMVRPQRRQQVRLIEIDDDDEKAIIEENKQKQLVRPRFSFHRHSRSTLEETKKATKNSATEQRVPDLTNHTQAFHVDSKKEAPTAPKLVSHWRTASCGAESKTITTFINLNKHSNAAHNQSEKVRIPNVIAKLMGLEELPTTTESKGPTQKEPHTKQEARSSKDLNKILQESSKHVELKTVDSEKRVPKAGSKKVMQTNKNSATPNTSLTVYADEILITQNAPVQSAAFEGRLHCKDPKNTSSSKKLNSKINNMTHNSINQLQQNSEILVDRKEKMRIKENINAKEQQSMKGAEIREPSLKDDFQRLTPHIHKHQDLVDAKEEKAATQPNTLQKDRKNINERLLVSRNQQKHPHNNQSQLPYILRTSESQVARIQAADIGQRNAKKNIQEKNFKGHERMLKSLSKPMQNVKNLQKNLSHRNNTTSSKKTSAGTLPPKTSSSEENSTSLKINMKKLPNENVQGQKPSSIGGKNSLENIEAPISTARSTKLAHVPPNLDNEQLDKSVNPGAMRESASPHNMAKPIKKKTSVLQPNQRTQNEIRRSKEADGESNKASNLAQDLQKYTQCTTILGKWTEEEKKDMEDKFHNATIQDINMKNSGSQKASKISLQNDKAPKFSDVVLIQHKGITKSTKPEGQKIPTSGMSGSLTENENHLKQILVKSQLFLNAAEALFRLHIPADIFHASASKYQDEENKVILDCAYEVMKRKGRRQEHMYHSTTSIGTIRVKCLDDLVKELHRDLEIFKYSNGNKCNEYDAADCLQEILQKDIENRNPDVNCMWDFGWGDTVYIEKEEVTRDVEKYMLNGLIDEVMRDLLPASIVVL